MASSVASNLTGHSTSSGVNPAAAGLPTEEVVRTWDSEELLKWLTSITPPPLSKFAGTAQAFANARIDGPTFLDLGPQWFSDGAAQGIPLGVAKRLDMLATSIKYNMSATSSRRRVRPSSPIQSPDLKGKKPRVVGGSDMPQASGETTAGSSQSVEELAAASNDTVIHKLASMYFAF